MALILIFRPAGLSKGREFAPLSMRPETPVSTPDALPLASEPTAQ